MPDSYHDRLSRVRKPRVHITYDVETDGSPEKVELPFVVGVLGDFSGDPTQELKSLKDRKFINVDRDNFDEVMQRMSPGLEMRVENTLNGDGSEMAVQLKFESMKDFEPAQVAEQVEPLRKLLAQRDSLRDLASKVDRSDKLEKLLEKVLQDEESRRVLAGELGLGDAGAETGATDNADGGAGDDDGEKPDDGGAA